jgi:peptidoglycan/LPS O-acetylase OafA/YrhL
MGVLRCLLALSVLLVHDVDGWFKLIDGAAAVQCFFLISGFYMALVLNERYAEVGSFYFNRALRLLPTYWAVLLLTVAVAVLAGRPTFVDTALQGDLTWDARALVLVSSLFLVGSDLMLFVRPTEAGLVFTAGFWTEPSHLFPYHPIPPAWSLPVEMAFYGLAPFLVRSRWRLLGGVLLGLAVRVIVYKAFGSHDPWRYRFFPAELGVFCAGGLAYHFYRSMQANDAARRFGGACLALLVAAMLAHPYLPPATRYVPITALVLASLPFVFALSRDSTADRWLGELSYPMYLLHFPVLDYVSGTLAVVACTFAGAIVLHLTVQVAAEGAFGRRPRRIGTRLEPAAGRGGLKPASMLRPVRIEP